LVLNPYFYEMDVSRFHDRLKNLQHLQQDTPDEWQTLSATYPYAAVVRQLSYVHTGLQNGKGNLSLLSLYKGDPLCFANMVQAVRSEQIEKTLQEDTYMRKSHLIQHPKANQVKL
jgi:hypothetical protein